MAVTRYDPNTVYLSGDKVIDNDHACSEAVTPGHLVELFNNAGVIRYRKHSAAGGNTPRAVALPHHMANKGVDDAYAANDLIEVAIGSPGSTWWMLIASGENITAGQNLESAGDGSLRAIASGTALYSAMENSAPSGAARRLRVEQI